MTRPLSKQLERRGRGAGATPRGRGRGFMNFGERKDPPHKGEKVFLNCCHKFLKNLRNSTLNCLFHIL